MPSRGGLGPGRWASRAITLLLVLTCACGGKNAAPTALPHPAAPTVPATTTPATPAASAPPAESTITDLSQLPAPADLPPRAASSVPELRGARGCDFDPALPHNRVSTDGRFGVFTPAAADSGPGATGMAFAMYRLNMTAYADANSLTIQSDNGGLPGDCYVGVSDYLRHRWAWFTPSHLPFSDQNPLLRYTSHESEMFVIVACPGKEPVRVKFVRAGGNLPPVAALLASPDSGAVPVDLHLDASASYDIDGEVADFQFSGNSWVGYPPSATPTCDTTANYPQLTSVYVTVRDSQGAPSTAEATLNLYRGPLAYLGAEPAKGQAPLAVLLLGSGGPADAGGPEVTQYAFDADGDGVFEQSGGQAWCCHTYTQSGTVTASVRVTDAAGHGTVASLPIQVEPDDGLPRWRRNYPAGAMPGFDQSLALIAGRPAIAAITADSHVYYVRAKDEQGSAWNAPVVGAVAGWGSWGDPRVGLVDIGGKPGLLYARSDSVTHVIFREADDADGLSWGPEHEVAMAPDVEWVSLALATFNGLPAVAYSFESGSLYFCRATDASSATWTTPQDLSHISVNDISIAEVDGRPAVAYSFERVCFTRANDAAGDSWPWPQLALEDNAAYPSLQVVDGKPAIAYWLTDGAGPGMPGKDLMYIHSSDADGNVWESAQTVDSSHELCGYTPSMAVVGGAPSIVCITEAGDNDPDWVPPLTYVRAAEAGGAAWDAPTYLDDPAASFNVSTPSLLQLSGGQSAISYCGNELVYVVYY